MDIENQQYCPVVASGASTSAESTKSAEKAPDLGQEPQQARILTRTVMNTYPSVVEGADATEILEYLRSGQLWRINSRRRNGLILYKAYHAEFAGPGAAVGGLFDLNCQRVIPVGNLSLIRPKSHQDRQDAYLIRRQWIKLTQQFTDQSMPLQRAQMILTQFETYFDQDTITRIPDEAFASLVGVLPYSVRMARRTPSKLQVKVKT